MRALRYTFSIMLFGLLGIDAVQAQDFDPSPLWPLCGRITENAPAGWVDSEGCPSDRWGNADFTDAPISSSFGPRPLASEGNRYDFHRGLDIATPIGTPVFAIADGLVRTAGEHSSYSDPVIIIRHYRPGQTSCSGVGCYHALYLHMSGWVVAKDETVNKGQLLGYTGASGSGFEHLHFELRDAPDFDAYSSWQRDAIHPMSVLPFVSNAVPDVSFDAVVGNETDNPVVSLTVTAARYDVVRVELTLLDATGAVVAQPGNVPDARGYNVLPSFFDLEDWNFQYTHKNSSNFPWESYDAGGVNECPYNDDHGNSYSAHVHMDQQDPGDYQAGQFNGVTMHTNKYWPGDYYLGLTFEALQGPAQCIEATVTVADGSETTTQWGTCTFDPQPPDDGGGGGKGGGKGSGKGGGKGGGGGGGSGGKGKKK